MTVQSWWSCLAAVAGFNLVVWLATAYALDRRRGGMSSDLHAVRRIQLALSAVYMLGCGFRSVLPVYDVPRLVMVDSWISSVAVGRSVATIAELCLVAQLAVMLNEFARATRSNYARRVSLIVVPLIAVAEMFSWYSVLTTANIGHVVEESIWGITAALLVSGIVAMRSRIVGTLRYVLDACCVMGIAYVAYMLMVDVPMYWDRWLADQAAGRSYLSISQGLSDVANRWTVSHNWRDWHSEVIWMTSYFSIAVWFSMALVHAPIVQEARERAPSQAGSSALAS